MIKGKILNINCSNCPLNDGLIYTSFPPQFKCTITNEWHSGEYRCGKVKIFYDENHKTPTDLVKPVPSDLVKPVPLNYDIIDETSLTGFKNSNNEYLYDSYLDNKELINLI